MQFSKVALASALVAVASAQDTTANGISVNLGGLASSAVAAGKSGLSALGSVHFTIPTAITFPSGAQSLASSFASEISAVGTNTAALASLNSKYSSLATNTAYLQSIATATNTGSSGGSTGGSSGGSSGGSTSSSSGMAPAPTGVAAGGILAAAGLAVVAML